MLEENFVVCYRFSPLQPMAVVNYLFTHFSISKNVTDTFFFFFKVAFMSQLAKTVGQRIQITIPIVDGCFIALE